MMTSSRRNAPDSQLQCSTMEKAMQLTHFTDYSLRVLMYLGLQEDRLVTISEIARVFDISHNHLVKVVNYLATEGFVQTVRGKAGGMMLAKDAAEIRIGEVVRSTEASFDLVECFNPATQNCCIISGCALRHLLKDAMNQFFEVLDRATLKDLLAQREFYSSALKLAPTEEILQGGLKRG